MKKPRFRSVLFAPWVVALPLSTSVLSSCGGEPPALTIGDVEYTESELITFNPSRRTRLAEITAFGLAVARGETEALGAPLVSRRRGEALLDALERELALELADVGEDALQARYASNPEYELSVRHLVVLVEEWAPEDEVESARSRAQEALRRIQDGEPFPEVAAAVSEEPGAQERGGLLQPGREGTWVDTFWDTASGLEVGEVSGVIRTPYGFHVLKLEDRQPVPFEEARYSVVEEVASLLPSQSEELKAWEDSVVSVVVVDSMVIQEAWAETGSLFPLLSHAALAGGDAPPLARWPGGSFSGEELKAFLVSLERLEWEHVTQGGLEELLRVSTGAAWRAFLSQVALDRGVALSPEKENSLGRDWEGSVASWAQALGFREGMRLDALKSAALNGVAASGQGARIARDELEGWAPMLLSAYPIGPEGS